MVSHSQDFLNTVCTNIVRWHPKTKQREVYGGNYDTYVQTRKEKEEAQMRAFEKEQEQVADIKQFIARFGHGTRKMAQQAQSREKLLRKIEEGGLTAAVEVDYVKKLRFPECGKLPPPVLQVQSVSFACACRPRAGAGSRAPRAPPPSHDPPHGRPRVAAAVHA